MTGPNRRHLPGNELVEAGLADLAHGRESIASLVVAIGAPRLRSLGVEVPDAGPSPELRLYRVLQNMYGDGAHAQYNALIGRLVSFERACEM